MSRVLTAGPCPLVTTAGSGETERAMGQLEQKDGAVGMGVEIGGDPRGHVSPRLCQTPSPMCHYSFGTNG